MATVFPCGTDGKKCAKLILDGESIKLARAFLLANWIPFCSAILPAVRAGQN